MSAMKSSCLLLILFMFILCSTNCDAARRGPKSKPESLKMAPPSRPEVTRLSEDSVMVRWDVQSVTDGLQINFFKIQFREIEENNRRGGGGGRRAPAWKTIDEEIAPHIHSFAVSGLKTGSSYKFRIAAVYANDDNKVGPKSAKFTLLKNPPMRKPVNGPLILVAESISQSAILLKWKYLDSDFDSVPIQGFFIHYRDIMSAGEYYKATALGANTRSHIITHLLPATSYEIKMQTFNIAGASSFSQIVTNRTFSVPEPTTTSTLPPIMVNNKDRGSGISGSNFPKILNPILGKQSFDQTFYVTIGITAIVVTLVAAVIAILCCNRKKDNQSNESSSNSSRDIVSNRKNKLKKDRHPKANSLHNLNHGGNGPAFGHELSFDNNQHYKVTNGHHLAKSMNGLTLKSNYNGFVFREVDSNLNSENVEMRIPLNRNPSQNRFVIQGNSIERSVDVTDEERIQIETRNRPMSASTFLGNRSLSSRDIKTATLNRNNVAAMNNNGMIDNPASNFAAISTLERRRKVYNEDIHPNCFTNSVKINRASTSFTRLNGTLERKKRSRYDLDNVSNDTQLENNGRPVPIPQIDPNNTRQVQGMINHVKNSYGNHQVIGTSGYGTDDEQLGSRKGVQSIDRDSDSVATMTSTNKTGTWSRSRAPSNNNNNINLNGALNQHNFPPTQRLTNGHHVLMQSSC